MSPMGGRAAGRLRDRSPSAATEAGAGRASLTARRPGTRRCPRPSRTGYTGPAVPDGSLPISRPFRDTPAVERGSVARSRSGRHPAVGPRSDERRGPRRRGLSLAGDGIVSPGVPTPRLRVSGDHPDLGVIELGDEAGDLFFQGGVGSSGQ